jgi:hypothetical protein
MAKKPSDKPSARRSTPKPADRSLEKQTAQDPFAIPAAKRIEKALTDGVKVSIGSFRNLVDWS